MTVVLIFPAGFLMGMPFPTGLARLEQWQSLRSAGPGRSTPPPACWARSAALVFAIYLGLVQTLLIGGLLYLAALAIVRAIRRRTAANSSTLELAGSSRMATTPAGTDRQIARLRFEGLDPEL